MNDINDAFNIAMVPAARWVNGATTQLSMFEVHSPKLMNLKSLSFIKARAGSIQ